jgi:hypothetical protein
MTHSAAFESFESSGSKAREETNCELLSLSDTASMRQFASSRTTPVRQIRTCRLSAFVERVLAQASYDTRVRSTSSAPGR